MRAFTVSTSDIARCPLRSMVPAHYRDDGSCLCTAELQVWSGGENTLVIHDGGREPLVTFYLDEHRVEFGPTYTPEAAVRAFWEGLVDPAAWETMVRAAVAELEASNAAEA